MKYQRKIFYINEYVAGVSGKKVGYVKLFQRGNRIQIEIHTEENYDFSGQKIYLLEKDKHAVNKLLFGTIYTGNSDVIMQRNTSELWEETQEISGVIIEGESPMICGGTDDAGISISKYLSDGRRQEIKAAEVKIEETMEPELEVPELQPDWEEEGEPIQVEMEVAHDEMYEYQKIIATHSNMYPFEDDEMNSCVQISPADFSDFPKTYWQMGSNTFLLQGYYKYRHLIFAESDDVFYIGIPGQYHRRDKYLADMFGFCRFKGIQKKQHQLGDFGYWMMSIQKPQSTDTWVDCGEDERLHQEME